LEKSAPETIYIKGIHNIVGATISQLDYDPKLKKTNAYTHTVLGVGPEGLSMQQWKSFAHHWQSYNKNSTPTQAYCFHLIEVFANCSEEDEIHPLTTEEIARHQ
jgi:hypothetical protein